MITRGSDRVMQGRRWVIQQVDEDGELIDEVVLSPRQADLAYAAVVTEGHAVPLAPLAVRQLFSEPETAFLLRHHFSLLQHGTAPGSYWFDREDAAPWRQAFDRFPLHLLEMAIRILLPDARPDAPPARSGWEELLADTEVESGFAQLLSLAGHLHARGGCYLALQGERTVCFYAEHPTELPGSGLSLSHWSAETGQLSPILPSWRAAT